MTGAEGSPTAGGTPGSDSSSPLAAAYHDHHAAVMAVAGRVCGPHHAADVAQDVFVALWRQPDKFDPERGSLRSFLLALAYHKAIDVLRSERARHGRERRVHASIQQVPAKVDDELLRNDTAVVVRAALDGLPAKERESIVTAFFGSCTYRETATRLGEAEGTVKSRIRSGLLRLGPVLAEDGLDPAPARVRPVAS